MKCFYHNDMDGRCAAALVAYYTGIRSPEDYFEVDYRNSLPIDSVQDGETVYIVDYSFTVNTVNKLRELWSMGCEIVWIDHHASSIKLQSTYQYEWVRYINGIRDNSLSGAALTYAWFVNGGKLDDLKLPKFIQYVDDYDRWVYKLGEETTHFKLGLEVLDFDALAPVWEELIDSEYRLESIIYHGSIIKKYIDRDNEFYLSTYGYESRLMDIPCYVVNKKCNSWIFGEKINVYPIVAVWAFDGEKYSYSIYSNDPEVDCSKIAESFGGGGHPGAAGFTSDTLLLRKY